MVVKIGGGYMYLWRAVNEEGEVLGMMLARFLLSSS
jgi:transposase-like protein